MRWTALCALALACGCDSDGSAVVSGTIGEFDFMEAPTVMHGGPYLILFDRTVECLDMAWVNKVYSESEPPASFDFVALEFANVDDGWWVANFSLGGGAGVSALGLMLEDDEFEWIRGREGTLNITEVGDREQDPVVGEFEVTFGEGAVTGEFESAYCRNLRP